MDDVTILSNKPYLKRKFKDYLINTSSFYNIFELVSNASTCDFNCKKEVQL